MRSFADCRGRRLRAWCALGLACALGWAGALAQRPVVVTADIRGGIGPPAAGYLERVLDAARQRQARLVVVSLDTPGGLDTSMREMIKAILASPVPVAIYVAPRGARAASAGTYLLYAGHVAAMAPGTNTGAATPVPIGIGGGEPRKPADEAKDIRDDKDGKDKAGGRSRTAAPADDKPLRDAVAYLRSLAELRGRNAEWARRAVLEADSIAASEALELGVIDVIANDVPHLLEQVDGRRVQVGGELRTLAVANADVQPIAPNWKEQLLATIANPNVALLLMMAAVYGLLFEFYAPGTGLPGVLGGIALLLGLYGLALLPVNVAGIGLVLLGLALIVAEAFVASFGVLGIGGIVAFAFGALLLLDGEIPGFSISWQLIGPALVVNAVLVALIGVFALKSRKRPVTAGAEAMLGGRAEALEDFEHEGWVRAFGERWRARTTRPVARGAVLRIARREGLVLDVEPNDQGEGR
jgi:membrane-bound serine protease (ClpP class)